MLALAYGIGVPPAYAKLENFMEADVVLGQPDFSSGTANNGGISASTFSTPRWITTDGTRLIIAESGNNRVMIWNQMPKSNAQPADVVLGQPDFASATANNGGRSERTLSSPRGVFTDGRRLYVADFSNNRVLIWNDIPETNFAPADLVIGQPDFSSATANNGGVSARGLSGPFALYADKDKLIIGDNTNNRLVIFAPPPMQNFEDADLVIGQPDFISNTQNHGGRSAASLNQAQQPFALKDKLFVPDVQNHRVLIWNKFPTRNFQPADVVLGQQDFSTASQGALLSNGLRSFNQVQGVFSDGIGLFVADRLNSRVLIWNQIPDQNNQLPDLVLGQPNFRTNTGNNGGRSAKSMSTVVSVFSDGKRVFVSDSGNHRVLIFNIKPLSTLKLGPQFEQGKAVIGKVFHDVNGNGVQDETQDKRPKTEGEKRKKGLFSFLSFPHALSGNPHSGSPIKDFG
ncbi:MAG: hypothetical protein HY584_05690, partial [Candidatus Omnitrophica bacterium]|nr:hypothetical protein [Candidatus Omnitrophota bacterium]